MILNRLRITSIASLALLCLSAQLSLAYAAPKSDLWDFWQAENLSPELAVGTSPESVDHSAWQAILDEFLVTDDPSGVNLFRYAAMLGDPDSEQDSASIQNLSQYIAYLEAIDPRTLSRAEQFAYWVNLYNALTVKVIVQEYPVTTIRKTGGGFFSRGPWDDELLLIADQEVTLNDIEHRILRPIWNDPRIHFIVNCASIGCPNLHPTALTADNYDRIAEEAKDTFLAHPRGVRIDGALITLSSIFTWYEEDFGENRNGMLRYIIENSEPQRAADLRQVMLSKSMDVKFQYDWDLNEPSSE